MQEIESVALLCVREVACIELQSALGQVASQLEDLGRKRRLEGLGLHGFEG